MKLHLILKLKDKVAGLVAPHWTSLLKTPKERAQKLHPAIELFFRKYDIPVKIATEYLKHGAHWSEDDIRHGFDRVFRVILLNNRALSEMQLEELAALENGSLIEYVHLGKIEQTPIPIFSTAQDFQGRAPAQQSLQLQTAHQYYSKGHPDVTIAVLDSGIDLSHPELQHSLLPGFDFVDILDGAGKFFGDFLDIDDDADDSIVGHGTHVAGIIAAKGINMPTGVSPRCKILPVRVLGALKERGRFVGAGLVDNINNGIKWAIDQGADIINMSLGIRHSGGGLPHEEVVAYAKQKGVTIIGASGNDGTENLYYPGALPHAIAVGAVDEQGELTPFSTRGKVTVTAPGTRIYSSYINDDYAFSTGTSQAAPFVSGQVALLKSYALQKGKKLTDKQLKFLIQQTADRIGKGLRSRAAGYGTINLIDSLKLLQYKIS